jgi:hypothetical protein
MVGRLQALLDILNVDIADVLVKKGAQRARNQVEVSILKMFVDAAIN